MDGRGARYSAPWQPATPTPLAQPMHRPAASYSCLGLCLRLEVAAHPLSLELKNCSPNPPTFPGLARQMSPCMRAHQHVRTAQPPSSPSPCSTAQHGRSPPTFPGTCRKPCQSRRSRARACVADWPPPSRAPASSPTPQGTGAPAPPAWERGRGGEAAVSGVRAQVFSPCKFALGARGRVSLHLRALQRHRRHRTRQGTGAPAGTAVL